MLRRNILSGAICLAAVLAASPAFGFDMGESDISGAVYTMTNAAGPNNVVVYDRACDGSLKSPRMVPTMGTGSGAGLGSQGAVVLSPDNRWLLVVNAGSNDVSTFQLEGAALNFMGKFPSGGQKPISVTIHDRLVYVLNGGAPNSIAGFWLNEQGALIPIAGSVRSLSGAATNPAEVQFSPYGDLLLVTEKGTNIIDGFPVSSNGLTGPRVSNPSHGIEPFGFMFGRRNQVFVSEAFGGAPNGSAVSSYLAHPDGSLTVITGSAPTHQTAACWISVHNSGRLTYSTNTGSASVSGFYAGLDGTLALLTPSGRSGVTPPGSSPIDQGFSFDGRFLYVLTSTVPTITAFKLEPDGSLGSLEAVQAPMTASGLAVR